jgi:hypothetical protein
VLVATVVVTVVSVIAAGEAAVAFDELWRRPLQRLLCFSSSTIVSIVSACKRT